MDLNFCTRMVNRSNYCSVLKKRKSSHKENVTVKLKRYSLNHEDAIHLNDISPSDESNQHKSNDTMCLICRKRSECYINNSSGSMATPSQQSKQENDIRNSQCCTNCVIKTVSAKQFSKWNALETVNHRSQSQRNVSAVSFGWCNSGSSPSGKSSSMPSCQLQSASSSLIAPSVSKTPSLSSTTTTTPSSSSTTTATIILSSSSPPQPLLSLASSSSSSLLLSSSAAAAAAELSSPSWSSSLSSRTKAATPFCSDSTCIRSSTNTRNSTSFRGSGQNCSNMFTNARVTNVCVLRTFAFIVTILEKCLTVMLGTRQQIPQEHNIYNRVTRRQSKQSNNSSPLPKYPIMFMFLVFSFMTLLLPTIANAEIRLQEPEYVCKTIDIRNSPAEFNRLEDCTVIEGFLLITLIDRQNHSEYEKFSFPKLTEVTGFVMVYRVNGLRTLSSLFPNLSVIRGKELFEGFALVIYENTHLEEVGLTSLTTITRGSVRIENNPALCFAETIDWTQINVNLTSDQNFFLKNKAKEECPQCPGDAAKQSDNTGLSVNCPVYQGQRHCWNSKACQKICPTTCKNNCNDELKCCDDACIGGCAKNNLSSCTSCRHFSKMDVCMDKCPANFFSYLERRCVTADVCTKDIGYKLEGTNKESLVAFEGVCDTVCPAGHNKVDHTCKKCVGKCFKECEGGLIDSVGAAKQMRGCTHIKKHGLVISIKRGGRHLMEELEQGLSMIEEIDTFLKVHRTYGMVSLAFFKNLKRIRGKILESDKFVLYVLENQDLESIWGVNQTVKMDEGRVYFHFNPKLCYSIIDNLRPSLKNGSQFDKNEVASDSNGSKGSCNTVPLYVKVIRVSSLSATVEITNPMKFEDDRVFIGYQFFHTEDPYRNVSMFGHRPCDDIWTSQDPSKDVNHAFLSLKPYTQYAYYVKTQTISSETRNGQSKIQYFRTKPDQPKSVQYLKAVSNSSSEIIIHWLRPAVTNGNLSHYTITAILDVTDKFKAERRNYCNEPLKEAVSGEAGFHPVIDNTNSGLLSNGADCKCDKNITRPGGSNPQIDDAIYESVISFENNIQNFIYVKQKKDEPQFDRSDRRRRAVELDNAVQPKPISATATLPPNGEVQFLMDKSGEFAINVSVTVNASVTEFVLTKLKHFSTYTIAVEACREKEVDAFSKECSTQSIAYARTQKLDNVDLIRNLQVDLEQSNTTRSNLRVKWDPPLRPNSLVVSYTIFYIAVDSPDAVHEKRCITDLDYHQNFTNGYVLTGLSTGNYSVWVRANSLAGEGIKSEPRYKYIPPNRITWQTITFICIGILIFIGIVVCVVYYIRKKFLAPPSDLKIFPTVNPYYISMQYLPDEWEVPRDKIIQLGALGQGSFGMVYEGILKNFDNKDDTPCAIKTVNENATDRERLNFLKEASVMKQFNTHHVVRLLGVCSRGQPALVIMELMKNGDLKAYLRQHRPDAESMSHGEPPMQPPTLDRILQIAIEIADGMAYLAAKKYVHRDLAARNCMVAADLTVKIGDFGMTRDIYETDYYRKGTKGLLPVRWMSPESLKDGIFSSASDVFSYGVVLWEMATLASQPYQGFSNDQVLRFVIDGGVMERPENCPDKLYKLMHRCWQHRPSARPTFMEIIRFLLDTADEKFKDVSFYHSAEAKDMLDQMHPDHDMDDVTTPLRVGEFDYKLNIDDNSSVEPHESPALDEDDEDEDDDNAQPHSPYSHSSAIISSTPGGHCKYSLKLEMNQSNPSLSLPSTSAAAMAASMSASATENVENVQPDPSYKYNELEQLQSFENNYNANTNTTYNATLAQKANKNYSSKYPNSLKRAVASTVQNVSNSLAPLRISNMNFLHRHLFKNSNNSSSAGGRGNRRNSGTKSETSSNNGNNNNSNTSEMTHNIETGGSRSFFSGLTPSHTSKNPNYQILDESLNVSAKQDENEQYPPEEKRTQTMSRARTCSSGSNGSGNSNNAIQQKQQQTAEQCNLTRDNSNLSTSNNFKDTKSSQKQNQPINPPSAHELSSSSGVKNSPITIKDDRNTIDASKVILTYTTPATKTPYQLKENWFRQLPQRPPNGFIGREG